MRWIRQRNKFSCGVVAILNVMKWAGRGATYEKDYAPIAKRLRLSRTGSCPKAFEQALSAVKQIQVKKKLDPSLRDLRRAIGPDSIVVLRYTHSRNINHVVLLEKQNQNFFFIVNIDTNGHWWYDNSFVRKRVRRRKSIAYCIKRRQ